jgi:predicted DNA-binding transcriptional regulator AlpA
MATKPSLQPIDPDSLMGIGQVTALLDVSKMTVHRWMADVALGFPEPLRIGGRNYWKRGELVAFISRQPRRAQVNRPTGTAPPQATKDAGVP